MTYLDQPCPRHYCGKSTLHQPEKVGNRWLCYCDTCRKYAGYKPTADGYELYLQGGEADELTRVKSFRLPFRFWDVTTSDVINALDRRRGNKR